MMENMTKNNGLGLENEKSDTDRKTAAVVGILFIIASVASVASYFFFSSIYDVDYLTTVSANESQMMIAVLLLFITAASIVGIPLVLYPVLKKHNETLALGYIGARTLEGLFFVFNIITLLSLLSLSQEYVSSASANTSYFQISGSLLMAEFDWNSLLLNIPFALSAILLGYVLYKSRLIPKWLAVWGFIGGALWLLGTILTQFGQGDVTFLAAPIAIQEMVFAAWLIVKGFNAPVITPESQAE